MKFVKKLPFYTLDKNDEKGYIIEEALYELEPDEEDDDHCEFRGQFGVCDTSRMRYGTTDITEPTFCARHFYAEVIAERSEGANYRLLEPEEVLSLATKLGKK